MKLGISSYSLVQHLRDKTMTIYDVMDWAKEHGCEHLELVPFELEFLLKDGSINEELVMGIKKKSEEIGLPLSTFSLNACVIQDTEEENRAEIARIKKYIDIAHMLGLKRMRHDTCTGQHPHGINTPHQFEVEFPRLVAAIQECADYAAQYGINTTLENHGRFVNGADRIIRLIEAAGRPNVKMTMDVGNFRCVNEENVVSVAKCVKYADMIHLKDFYIRDPQKVPNFNEGVSGNRHGDFFVTAYGEILRGAILGHGDLDIWKILKTIKDFGYDGHISIEFEGMEECCHATDLCLKTARYIWDRV